MRRAVFLPNTSADEEATTTAAGGGSDLPGAPATPNAALAPHPSGRSLLRTASTRDPQQLQQRKRSRAPSLRLAPLSPPQAPHQQREAAAAATPTALPPQPPPPPPIPRLSFG
eukprot:Rhum_TRINITY_DN10316_c0_g1::Rhum_TRINITY_DN10316_c0_g1_i1::g.37937::m.37937